jgi:tetratricopeptide (TPR) repeat protein
MIKTLVDLLGNFYASNDFTNFEAIARSIQSTIPNDPVSLQFLGLVYYRTGRIKDAAHIFDKLVRRRKPTLDTEPTKITPDLPPGDYAAAACYQAATQRSSKLAQAWYDLGNALLDLRKFRQAIPAFRSALKAQPESTQAMLAIGRTALQVGDLAAAEEGFSRLRELQPNNDEAYLGLAQIYRKRRDFATARACFVRARMLRGNRTGIDNLKTRRGSG